VYLCNSFLSQAEDYQVGVLIHEAVHHSGPTDVTYDTNQMQREYQSRQLENAANYQYFAQTVAKGGSCEDQDGNCRHYTSYCNTDRIKDLCKKTCGACGSGGGCADTYGSCQWYRDNNYCGTESVLAQCRSTCGACR